MHAFPERDDSAQRDAIEGTSAFHRARDCVVSRQQWRDDHAIGENGLTEPEDIGFVICASCGARIKADREWCLRCHEPLRAFKKPEIPLPSWVDALGGGTLIFGAVG